MRPPSSFVLRNKGFNAVELTSYADSGAPPFQEAVGAGRGRGKEEGGRRWRFSTELSVWKSLLLGPWQVISIWTHRSNWLTFDDTLPPSHGWRAYNTETKQTWQKFFFFSLLFICNSETVTEIYGSINSNVGQKYYPDNFTVTAARPRSTGTVWAVMATSKRRSSEAPCSGLIDQVPPANPRSAPLCPKIREWVWRRTWTTFFFSSKQFFMQTVEPVARISGPATKCNG